MAGNWKRTHRSFVEGWRSEEFGAVVSTVDGEPVEVQLQSGNQVFAASHKDGPWVVADTLRASTQSGSLARAQAALDSWIAERPFASAPTHVETDAQQAGQCRAPSREWSISEAEGRRTEDMWTCTAFGGSVFTTANIPTGVMFDDDRTRDYNVRSIDEDWVIIRRGACSAAASAQRDLRAQEILDAWVEDHAKILEHARRITPPDARS